MKGVWFKASESWVECHLTKRVIDDCSHSGKVDADVAYWVEKLYPQLDTIPPELIKRILKGTGAWNDLQLDDEDQNLRRFLWLAASQAKEENTCTVYME